MNERLGMSSDYTYSYPSMDKVPIRIVLNMVVMSLLKLMLLNLSLKWEYMWVSIYSRAIGNGEIIRNSNYLYYSLVFHMWLIALAVVAVNGNNLKLELSLMAYVHM